MGAARYIGRVGGLAVALGIGTAIATGSGIAAADATAPSSAATSSATSSVSAGATTKPAPKPKKTSAASPTIKKSKARGTRTSASTPAKSTPAPREQKVLTAVRAAVSRLADRAASHDAGTAPTAPAPSPGAWSLLAFARRESEKRASTVADRTSVTPAAAVQTASVPLAAVSVPNFPKPGAQLSASTQFVQWVTGNYQTGNPLIANTLNRFGIDGTDVGVTWDNGMADDPSTPYDEHQVLMAFGDTFSGPNMTGNWRFNTLLRSSDRDLSDGITIPNGEWFNGNMFGGTPLSSPTTARQVIRGDGFPAGVTLIPTAGISVPTPGTQFGVTQYVDVMSVTKWGAAGSWTTNYSAIAYSTDNGENWTIAPSSVRYNSPLGGNKNFQQGAFVRPGDGYVYMYGTPNGRHGAAYVSRVAEADILDPDQYEYYSAGSAGGFFGMGARPAGWYADNPAAATAIFGKAKGFRALTSPGNQVSEMSVQYSQELGEYVVLYGDRSNNIVMRTSDTPEGAWSSANVLLTQQPGGIYAPMMHPWSPSTLGTGTDLYWNLSLYSEYNVMLMKTDLTKV